MMNQIKTILSLITIMALLFGSGLSFGNQPVSAADGEEQSLPPLVLAEKGNPKLDSYLNQLVLAQASKRAASFAQESNFEMAGGDDVRVIVESLPDQIDTVAKTTSTLGIVEASYDNLLQVVVPVTNLTALADTPGIRLVRMPQYPLPATIISEGVTLIDADGWQSARL